MTPPATGDGQQGKNPTFEQGTAERVRHLTAKPREARVKLEVPPGRPDRAQRAEKN